MTTRRPDRLVWWLRAVERTLLVIAVLALGWYAMAFVTARQDQAALGRELANRMLRPAAATATSPRLAPAPGALIGRLEVPRLGVSAIAREGADAKTLRRAVGHVPDTALPGESGNAAFAGHRDTFFRRLENVRSGDEIVVTTPGGRYQYVVRETRVVAPRDVWVLDPTAEPTLTLVTCYPFYYLGSAPDRFIVRAALRERGN